MFVKSSLRDRLDCLVAFVGMILLCLLPPCLPTSRSPAAHFRFRLPSAISLPPTAPFRLQLPSACGSLHTTLFQRLFSHTLCSRLERFSTAINLSNLCAANSNISALMRFAVGTICLRKNGITCSRAPKPLPLRLPTPL